MAEFPPVETIEDFRRLDDGEIMEGYFDGFHGGPPPGSNRSRAFWHGWRNGRVDAGLAKPDFAQLALERAFQTITAASI
jgi:site-specific DNA-cytosine methylase